MAKAVSEIEIHAPIKKVFDVITDYESYPEFLSDCKDVAVAKKTKTGAEVHFEVSVIKKIKYTLNMKFKAPKKVTWSLVKGDFMKSNDGSWELEEVKKGVTKAIYSIEMNFGALVPSKITKALVSTNLPSMLRSFKEHIESL